LRFKKRKAVVPERIFNYLLFFSTPKSLRRMGTKNFGVCSKTIFIMRLPKEFFAFATVYAFFAPRDLFF
jgi:hypothetical protein